MSKTLLSPRHWDLVLSLEPLVNLRSGSWLPSGTTVPERFSKSPSLERFVLQERTPGKINTEVQCQTRAPSEILTPERAPLPPSRTPAPRPAHQATPSDSSVILTPQSPGAWGVTCPWHSLLNPRWMILGCPCPGPASHWGRFWSQGRDSTQNLEATRIAKRKK